MIHLSSLVFIAFTGVLIVPPDPCTLERSQGVEIATLVRNPEAYDQKRISVSGTLKSGHLGVDISSPSGQSLRVRAPEEIKAGEPVKPCQDELFKRFWNLASKRQPPDDDLGFNVTVEGIVRILRKNA